MKKRITFIFVCVLLFILGIECAYAYNASRGTAYSIGTDYSGFWPWQGDINTSQDAILAQTTFGTMGFNSYYNTMPTYQYMRGNNPYTGFPRMESKILFLSGHGNYNHIAFNYKQNGGDYMTGVYYGYNWDSSSGYKYAGIYSYNMNKVGLIVFGACKTANGLDNISKRANSIGARTTIGWTVSISADSHSKWFQNFLYELSKSGRIVNAAVNYANSFSYNDNGVKNMIVYGDTQYVPTWDVGSETMYLVTNHQPQNTRYYVKIKLEKNYTMDSLGEIINSYIQNNIDKNFDIKNYMFEINGEGTRKYYDFNLLINGAMSDSAYTVVIDDNEIVEIVDNTKEIVNNISSFSLDAVYDVKQKRMADEIRNNINKLNYNYELVSQKIKTIYISKENKYKTLILSEIFDKLTQSYFVREDIL